MTEVNSDPTILKLGHITIGESVIILKEPLSMELSKADHEYIISNDDFGILATGNNIDQMIKDINEQFTVIWTAYIRPDDELTTSGQMLKESLMDRFVVNGIVFGSGEL